MPIDRRNLRDQVREQLTEWLADGRLRAGQHLDEGALARALGVSRTPVREALAGLAREGLIEAVPRHGFQVPALAAETVQELFPLIGALEGLAIRLAGRSLPELAAPLAEIQARLAVAQLTPRQRWDLDRRWHETLSSRHNNRELAASLERLRGRIRHYEGLWGRPAAEQESLRAEHDAIIVLVTEGQAERAAEAVLAHWVRAVRPATQWLAGLER